MAYMSLNSLAKKQKIFAIILCLFSVIPQTFQLQVSEAVLQAREAILNDIVQRYSSMISPAYIVGNKTIVKVMLKVMTIDCIDHSKMDFSLTMLMEMIWVDPRLSYTKIQNDSCNYVRVSNKAMSMIWIPDIYFINAKRAYFHTVTAPNKVMHIYPSGKVVYNMRMSLVMSCEMNLRKFPFDDQMCHIALESYGHSVATLDIKWREERPLIIDENLPLPHFTLTRTVEAYCTKMYTYKTYSCIRAEIYMVRQYGYYIIQIYLPSALIVCLSWFSFFLDAEATPARITLGILTVLTMTTQNKEAKAQLPRVSYIKAIDVYMQVSLLFVFGALIEFAIVNFYTRADHQIVKVQNEIHQDNGEGDLPSTKLPTDRAKVADTTDVVQEENDINENAKRKTVADIKNILKKSIQKMDNKSGKKFDLQNDFSSPVDKPIKPKRRLMHFSIHVPKLVAAKNIDGVARISFPLTYLLFNTVYWAFYLNWHIEPRLSAAT